MQCEGKSYFFLFHSINNKQRNGPEKGAKRKELFVLITTSCILLSTPAGDEDEFIQLESYTFNSGSTTSHLNLRSLLSLSLSLSLSQYEM